jgi:hypothetical protein
MAAADGAPAESVQAPPRVRRRYGEIFVQLATITAGVLIALFFDGLVAWNQNRELVNQARTMIRRELTDNKRELDGGLAAMDASGRRLDHALRFANDVLATGRTDVQDLLVGRTFAELSSASWHTAERTGALGYMDYDEVQRYSKLYALQDLFVTHQRQSVDRVAAAIAIVATDDPTKAPRADLETFRQHIMALRGDLLVERDLGKALTAAYAGELKR